MLTCQLSRYVPFRAAEAVELQPKNKAKGKANKQAQNKGPSD
jgi:hypothetical protein